MFKTYYKVKLTLTVITWLIMLIEAYKFYRRMEKAMNGESKKQKRDRKNEYVIEFVD